MVLILFDVQEVQKPVSTVVTALLDKNAKLEQQARKDQILAVLSVEDAIFCFLWAT